MPSPRCWKCKAPLDLMAGRPVGRTESCPECDADIRSCRGCAFFVLAHGLCHEPTAEPPQDKERANFCSAYRLAAAPDPESPSAPATSDAEEAKRRLERLFTKE